MNETPHAPTDQSGHVIERTDEGLQCFFSEKIGRDFGSPTGGWTQDRKEATVMTITKAESLLTHGLQHVAPYCKVVPQ